MQRHDAPLCASPSAFAAWQWRLRSVRIAMAHRLIRMRQRYLRHHEMAAIIVSNGGGNIGSK